MYSDNNSSSESSPPSSPTSTSSTLSSSSSASSSTSKNPFDRTLPLKSKFIDRSNKQLKKLTKKGEKTPSIKKINKKCNQITLEECSLGDLKLIAKKEGIKYSNLKKEEIIEIIQKKRLEIEEEKKIIDNSYEIPISKFEKPILDKPKDVKEFIIPPDIKRSDYLDNLAKQTYKFSFYDKSKKKECDKNTLKNCDIKKLKLIAKEEGYDGYDKLSTKQQLIKFITDKREENKKSYIKKDPTLKIQNKSEIPPKIPAKIQVKNEEEELQSFYENLFYEIYKNRKQIIEEDDYVNKISLKIKNINKNKNISDSTKETILKIFEKLDYYLLRKFANQYSKQFLESEGPYLSLNDFFEFFKNKPEIARYIKEKDIKPKVKIPYKKEINEILKEEVTDEISKKAEEKLFDIIVNLTRYKDEYIYILNTGNTATIQEFKDRVLDELFNDPKYTKNIIDNIRDKSSNIEKFLTNLGQIVIYLIPIKNINNEIFIDNLLEGMYKADDIVNLTPIEKLPEVFDNNLISNKIKKEITNILQIFLNSFTTVFINEIYSDKIQDYTNIIPVFPDIKFLDCVNYDNIKHISPDDLIKYNDSDKIYCFSVKNIVENNLFNNPYTNNEFSKEFLKSSLQKYKINYPSPDILKKNEELAPGLLDFVLTNLYNMEKDTNAGDVESNYVEEDYTEDAGDDNEGEDEDVDEEDEDEVEDVTDEEDGVEDVTDEEDDTEDEDGTEDEDTDEEDEDDYEYEDEDENENEDEDKDKYKNCKDIHNNIDNTKIINDNKNICQKCKIAIDPDKDLKTFIFANKKETVIYFCCFKCFEDYKMPKLKL